MPSSDCREVVSEGAGRRGFLKQAGLAVAGAVAAVVADRPDHVRPEATAGERHIDTVTGAELRSPHDLAG